MSIILLFVLFSPLLVLGDGNQATFVNVQFKGYSVFTLKFTQTIVKADSLKEELPSGIYDHLEFDEQNIPILKTNSISDIETLDELTIKNSRVREIQPGAFKNLPLLRKLSLTGNQLETISEGVFNGLPLSMLDLQRNRIRNIAPDALNDMPSLLNINLADNFISAWNSRWFRKVPLLTRISMQNNRLQIIPAGAFANLNGDKKFGSVKLTINFIFSHNMISRIEAGAFEGLGHINNLWLDNNNLTDFADNLLEGVEVQYLSLAHNQIKCLRGNLSKIFKAETTNLDGNPFDCVCLEKLEGWVKEYKKNVDFFYAHMTCATERLNQKMEDIRRMLRKPEEPKEIEAMTTGPPDDGEVEILFK